MIHEKLYLSANVLKKYLSVIKRTDSVRSIGYVRSITGNLIKSDGPDTKLGDICHIVKSDTEYVSAEVVGFDEGCVLLAPLSELTEIHPGSRVVAIENRFYGYISEKLIGRCINAMCDPLDDKEKVISDDIYILDQKPPSPLSRPLITEPLYTGVRSIDSFLTLGKGQRIGIFSGSGVGKSTLLGMIARYSKADINVIALIGERSREINEFIQRELGEHGMKRSVLVVAAANESPMHKIKASYLATSIAEFFRDQGKEVLLLMDSLTRLAMAQREIGLAAGEPAATKGYPPSVYSMIPNLLERAGTSEKGSITGIYTVLVEADDMNEPVSDTVRGVLDGHIILDRGLANKGHFPAIDVPGSISRLMPQVTSKDNYKMASYLRELLSSYKENEEIIHLGAYSHGSNPLLDKAIQIKKSLDVFLRQEIQDYTLSEETWDEVRKLYSMTQYSGIAPRRTAAA